MAKFIIREMLPEDEYYVSTCSHVSESAETDASAKKRLGVLRALIARGAVVKAALIGSAHVGFAHGIPIEASSWGPVGRDLMVIPCLYVSKRGTQLGIGRALVEAIERDARRLGRLGVTTTAFRDLPGAAWFMPATFFEHLGYRSIDERDRAVLLWKAFSDQAETPRFLKPSYAFTPIESKVVVDLFWNDFCQTSGIEAQRVREVCAEFGNRIVLNEHCTDQRDVLLAHEVERAIYVNGREIGWGYEAPKEGIREAIEQALGTA